MSGKKVFTSSINWVDLASKVPEHQKSLFVAFKSKSDAYLRKVQSLPDSLPTIDWAYYKNNIGTPGLVEEFEKQYGQVKVPYPPDNVSQSIDELEKEIRKDIETFKAESDARIAECKKKLAHLNSVVPYDQMTMEEFREAFPEEALDPINKPTFWPHLPEDQIGYEQKIAAEKAAEEAAEKAAKEAAEKEKEKLLTAKSEVEKGGKDKKK